MEYKSPVFLYGMPRSVANNGARVLVSSSFSRDSPAKLMFLVESGLRVCRICVASDRNADAAIAAEYECLVEESRPVLLVKALLCRRHSLTRPSEMPDTR